MITDLIDYIEDSIVSLKKEGVEPNTIFINWRDRILLEKTEDIYEYLTPVYALEHPTINSKDKLFGLDVIYIDEGPTCVVRKAKNKRFKRSVDDF